MRVLLDTHVLLWAAITPDRLAAATRALLDDPANELLFSAASLWEIAIKLARGREDFMVDPVDLRQALLAAGYQEVAVTGAHALALLGLPDLHRDPFDRILLAQARVEDLVLLTADDHLLRYGPPARRVMVHPAPSQPGLRRP